MPWIGTSPKQERFITQSRAAINLAGGAVRSGKSVGVNLRFVHYCKYGPPGEFLAVGKTERTLTRNVLDPLREFLGPAMNVNHGRGVAWIGGRKIYLIGANDERSASKLQGATIAGALGDEVTTWPENFFAMLLSRLSVPGARFFGTYNPDGPYHWLKRRYIDNAEQVGLRNFGFRLEDNPFLAADFVDRLKRQYRAAGQLWYKRFVLGLWALAEGAVYQMFSDARHVKPAPAGLPRLEVAVDYGAANPTAALLLAHDGKPPVYVVREFHHDGRESGALSPSQLADALVAWLGGVEPRAVIVDPSALGFITELENRGLRAVPADNDVLEGIRLVGQMFGEDLLFIDPGCRHLLDEIGGYSWDAKAAARGEDKPVKAHDHALDALRYGVFTRFNSGAWIYRPMSMEGI